jgi:methionyl aminopeptidase
MKAPVATLRSNDDCWCGSGRKYKRCHKPLEGRIAPGEISPRRAVPERIVRPPYADTGHPQRWPESRVKSPEVIERMREAGRLAGEVLKLAGEMVAPGVVTDDIDAYVHELCLERDAYPSPLNYNGFPQSVCTSVNEALPRHPRQPGATGRRHRQPRRHVVHRWRARRHQRHVLRR